MNREDTIEKLKSYAPIITSLRLSHDMGYEFSAVVPNGVICGEPGMLLNYSGGEWPLSKWRSKTELEYKNLTNKFLIDEVWNVIPWDDLSDEEIEQWLADVIYETMIHERLEVVYLISNGKYKISFSTYLQSVDNEAISACEWGHGDERELAMRPIIHNNWDLVEQIIGYAVNDNFSGDLPFEETRYFSIDNEGFFEYSNDVAEIEAKIIIKKC